MDRELEELVCERAAGCCEYCSFPQSFAALPFQFDHIIAKKHRGETVADNLALACSYCNRYKGPNVAGIDPETNTHTPLFHPRHDSWSDHFRWNGPQLVGLTPIGRTTIDVLRINHPDAVA
ncbi:MAG TPA: HNH endonuclease signature motif containing protein, partial [Planctomycetaceae bacterium]|nr:HNH endonuclease signature motif containing protein [Planctomycetaceae bacterium]